jgi:hypothetical protein
MILSDTQNFSLNVNGGPHPCGSTTPTIGANSTGTVAIRFTPQSRGEFETKFTVGFEDLNTPSFSVLLKGFGAQPGGSDCFIASVFKGSPLAGRIGVLRSFRDRHLVVNPTGKALVDMYYACSPVIADCLARHQILKTATRWALTPVLYVLGHPLVAQYLGLTYKKASRNRGQFIQYTQIFEK